MKPFKKIIPFVLICVLTNCTFGQSTNYIEPCSIDIIREMKNETSEKTILRFIKTYQEECNNNAEFSPAANWHLFYLIEKFPQLTLNSFSKAELELDIDLDHLLENYKYPVTEDINIRVIYQTVEKMPASGLRTRILANLEFQLKE